MTFILAVISSTVGSLIGSFVSYYAGAYGGKPFVSRFGKYLLLDMHDLEMTERFFAKYGEGTVFVSRFIPVVRHVISIPAGIGRMNQWKFLRIRWWALRRGIAYCCVLAMNLGPLAEVLKYTGLLDAVVIAVLLVLAALFVHRHMSKKEGRSRRGR